MNKNLFSDIPTKNKDDHENKQSNLCLNNLNSLLYQKTIQQIVICQHCNLPGHKLKRYIVYLANPNNLSKQNDTNSLFLSVYIKFYSNSFYI